MKNFIVGTLMFAAMAVVAVICVGAVNAQSSSPRQAPLSTYSPAQIVKSWTWSGYEHIVFEVDGHQYLEVRYKGYHDNGAINVIHYESCPCKEKPAAKNPQPRYFSKEMRMMKYNEQNGICQHCKKHFEFNEMHGDHIVPYSKGGTTTFDNLQMLCAPCNLKKGNRYSY